MGDDSEIEGYGRRTPELSSAALRKKHDTTNIEKKTDRPFNLRLRLRRRLTSQEASW